MVLYSPYSVEGVNVATDRFSLWSDWRDEDMHSRETHSLIEKVIESTLPTTLYT